MTQLAEFSVADIVEAADLLRRASASQRLGPRLASEVKEKQRVLLEHLASRPGMELAAFILAQ